MSNSSWNDHLPSSDSIALVVKEHIHSKGHVVDKQIIDKPNHFGNDCYCCQSAGHLTHWPLGDLNVFLKM